MVAVCWLSVDPRDGKIDFYPHIIANKIEKAYQDSKELIDLGKDFFDATVNFGNNNRTDNDNLSNLYCYQTTKPCYSGRGYVKRSGYRSVLRYVIENYNSDSEQDYTYNFYTKDVNGEKRIVEHHSTSYYRKNSDIIPKEFIVEFENINSLETSLTTWKPEYFDNLNIDKSKYVIVWQWCKGVPERHGNVYDLGNEWWTPFLCTQNNIIEDAYENKQKDVEIVLPFDNSKRTIVFLQDSCYAKQHDFVNSKVRIVRRKLISIANLENILTNNPSNSHEPGSSDGPGSSDDPPSSIPHEFYCPITQDIMIDPVKTVDGHVYDRTAIDRWFDFNSTSPLTGLQLTSIQLEPYTSLKIRIINFKTRYPQLII